jgi:hypothetical protein
LHRNGPLQRVIQGKIQGGIEETGRQGRRRRKLLDDLKERRGYSHLKDEALDRTMWRARFGGGFGPVVRQTAKWMDAATRDLAKCFNVFKEIYLVSGDWFRELCHYFQLFIQHHTHYINVVHVEYILIFLRY